MAKKTKDTTATVKKEAKATAPADPEKTKNLVRLLNILALLLAITAFLLQLFAVLSHHWKWQSTGLRQIMSPTYHYAQPNVYEDSRLDQSYGLYARDVKVYANNDEQLAFRSGTRFPRIDDDDQEANFHQCLYQTSTLRGAFLTCSNQVVSSQLCHCRRYAYWNWVIALEIIALVLLGIVVFLTALLPTQFQALLKLAAAGLALIAFILLLVGLILILAHLKRETRSLSDQYPHIYQRLGDKLTVVHDQYRGEQRVSTALRRAVRRQTVVNHPPEHYRAYALLPSQHPYNDTHFQEYSEQVRTWVYKPYSSLAGPAAYASSGYAPAAYAPAAYAPLQQQNQDSYVVTSRRNTTVAPVYNRYGPVLGYDKVFDNTYAGIGWSTILSIIAMVLSLLLPLLLIFSWLTGKKLQPTTKTVTKKDKIEYVSVAQDELHAQPVPIRTIPAEYNPNLPTGDAIVKTHHVSSQFVPQRPTPTNQNPDYPGGNVTVTTYNTPVQAAPRPIPTGYDSHGPSGDALVRAQHVLPSSVSIPPRTIPPNYDPNYPTGDAVVKTHHPYGHPPPPPRPPHTVYDPYRSTGNTPSTPPVTQETEQVINVRIPDVYQ